MVHVELPSSDVFRHSRTESSCRSYRNADRSEKHDSSRKDVEIECKIKESQEKLYIIPNIRCRDYAKCNVDLTAFRSIGIDNAGTCFKSLSKTRSFCMMHQLEERSFVFFLSESCFFLRFLPFAFSLPERILPCLMP